ncbi:hypothetical protein [Embleya hyalina]|uniref:Uncharacterized protein n=1 Tax=Embleya hyalina TaxID=516124 RepID=A0A401Z3Z8_9ACTN|nr:hypothetical protein [Embleya hyalina]GCE01567.1 hypothetical protein EHYA_09333 [Embleya hyalina]
MNHDRDEDVTITIVLPDDSGARLPNCTRTSGCLLPQGHPSPRCMVPNTRR